LLKFIFSELSNISKQTALLESLGWSEEKLEEVLQICNSSILKMTDNSHEYSSPNRFRDEISHDLRDILTEDQTKAVLDILNDIISQSLEGIMSDGN